mmetsp:Transcript_18022/g.51252  ORF Transcript_18022/g.51252 Transcript_18022/m.51252 type:complete len:259 (+) Transcript_18022:472-1248(+)
MCLRRPATLVCKSCFLLSWRARLLRTIMMGLLRLLTAFGIDTTAAAASPAPLFLPLFFFLSARPLSTLASFSARVRFFLLTPRRSSGFTRSVSASWSSLFSSSDPLASLSASLSVSHSSPPALCDDNGFLPLPPMATSASCLSFNLRIFAKSSWPRTRSNMAALVVSVLCCSSSGLLRLVPLPRGSPSSCRSSSPSSASLSSSSSSSRSSSSMSRSLSSSGCWPSPCSSSSSCSCSSSSGCSCSCCCAFLASRSMPST